MYYHFRVKLTTDQSEQGLAGKWHQLAEFQEGPMALLWIPLPFLQDLTYSASERLSSVMFRLICLLKKKKQQQPQEKVELI